MIVMVQRCGPLCTLPWTRKWIHCTQIVSAVTFCVAHNFFFCMCRVVRKTVTGQPVWITSEMCLPHWWIEPITVLIFVSVGEVWSVSDHWQICFCQWLKQVDYWCSHSSEIRPPPAHFLSAEPQSGTETCKLFPQICNTINTRWQWKNLWNPLIINIEILSF